MPLQRFIKVKGKPGIPVANPWTLGAMPSPRFAGKVRDAALEGEPEPMARYRDVEEVLPSHVDLLKAIDAGDLAMVGRCEAASHEEAVKKMSSAEKPKKGS